MPIARALLLSLLCATAALAADDAAPSAPPTAAGDAAATAPASAPDATAESPATEGATAADSVQSPSTTAVAPRKLPKLVVDAPIQDVGRVARGERVKVEFSIANSGDDVLKIKDAQPGCGCTVASYDKQIEPGESGKVKAQVDTSAFDGPIAKGITVLTNDPTAPRVLLTIKLDVLSFVRYSPATARMLYVVNQEPPKTAINLWATDGTDLGKPTVESTLPFVEASIHPAAENERVADAPDAQWRIDVAMTDQAKPGPLAGELVVRTNHPKQPKLEIPISGFVRNLLQAQPQIADFGVYDRGSAQPKRFVLKLFNFGQEAVEIKSVETDLPFVTASATAEDAGRRYRIELRLAPDAPKGKFSGRLTIETSSGVMPEVELPIRGKVG